MQVDSKEFRNLLAYVLHTFRQMEQELLAHQIVLLGIRKSSIVGDEVDVLLQSARDCPELQQHLHEKYDKAMTQFVQAIEDEFASEEALEFLRNYKPPGPMQ